MDESDVRRELSEAWELDVTDDVITARHDSGVELVLIEADRSHEIICNVVQPIEVDEYRFEPITDSALYADNRHALAGISEIASAVQCGQRSVDVLAAIPHNGDPGDVDPSIVDEPARLQHALAETSFCDIIFVRRDELPDRVDVDDFRPAVKSIVEVIYGKTTEIPDIFEELESERQAYGEASIEVTTVTEDDITHIHD